MKSIFFYVQIIDHMSIRILRAFALEVGYFVLITLGSWLEFMNRIIS